MNDSPIDKPVKCFDGRCVSDKSKCREFIKCEKGKVLCPGGRVCAKEGNCPNIEVFEEGFFKCQTSECIKSFVYNVFYNYIFIN